MLKSINKVIKVLILSDIFLLTGFGFISPIFAIFISQRIEGGGVEVAGFAAAIYWIVKSVLQIPFGKFLDKNKGERDDLYFVIIGNILAALAAFGYIFSSLAWHIYLCQGIYSLGMAMNIPGWAAMFTRHIDKGKEAFEWATRSSLIGIGAGVSGALGGIIASKFDFDILFIIVGIFAVISGFLPFLLYKDISPKDKIFPRVLKTKGVQESYLPKS